MPSKVSCGLMKSKTLELVFVSLSDGFVFPFRPVAVIDSAHS